MVCDVVASYTKNQMVPSYRTTVQLATVVHTSLKTVTTGYHQCLLPVVSPGGGGGGGGGCMWVHLHPIYAPVHPSYACACSFIAYLHV